MLCPASIPICDQHHLNDWSLLIEGGFLCSQHSYIHRRIMLFSAQLQPGSTAWDASKSCKNHWEEPGLERMGGWKTSPQQMKEGGGFEHFWVLHQQHRLPEQLGKKIIRQQAKKGQKFHTQMNGQREFRNEKTDNVQVLFIQYNLS